MGKQFKTSFFSRRLWVSVFFFRYGPRLRVGPYERKKKEKGKSFVLLFPVSIATWTRNQGATRTREFRTRYGGTYLEG